MTVFIVLALAALTIKTSQYAAIRLVDMMATAIAAWYRWRSERLAVGILAHRPLAASADVVLTRSASRAHRRLLARHLRLSIAMTGHYSLFPAPSQRGYAIADALMVKTA